MDVVYQQCCGLDVHTKRVVACLLTSPSVGEVVRTVRTFGTMTEDLLALSDWLAEANCTHVAMESTGVYWKPIWNLLEDAFSLLLVNPRDIKAVPGRKTDITDAEWIADLLRHGLLRGSYVPDRPQRELRELTRYRTSLVRERTAQANPAAEDPGGGEHHARISRDRYLGHIGPGNAPGPRGRSNGCGGARAIGQGAVAGEDSRTGARADREVHPHQRFMVAEHLAHIDFIEESIERVSGEITARLQPCAEAVARLDTIPGVGPYLAEALIAEIGTDMSRFPTPGHLASWAGMCPGNHESAGKRRSGRTRKGSPWLRALLVQAAHAGAHKKDTYLGAQYRRLAVRRGKSRAAVAVGHSILVIAYHLLRDGTIYHDLGPHYFDERDRRAVERRLVHRLEGLGYTVSLKPAA
jgi:transposase